MAPEPKGGRKRATKKTAARASGTSEVVEESKPEIVEALIEEKRTSWTYCRYRCFR